MYQAEIAQIVSDWVNQKRAFTAYEVTQQLRQQGLFVRHGHIKPMIHEQMEVYATFGSYCITDVVVGQENGMPLYAMLYHHVTYNPANYVALPRQPNRTPVQQVATPVSSISMVSSPSVTTLDKSVTKRVDKRSTLLIPTHIMKEAGIQPGQQVYVCTDGAGSIIVTAQPDNQKTVKHGCFTVDSHNNVRITQSCLQKAGAGGSVYEVLGGDQVKIKRLG